MLKRWGVVSLGVVVGVAVVALAFNGRGCTERSRIQREYAAKEAEARATVDERWSPIEMHTIPQGTETSLRDDVWERLDVLLSEHDDVALVHALADTLTAQLAARSSGAQAYFDFATKDISTQLLAPDSRWWGPIGQYLKLYMGTEPDPNNPEQAFKQFLEHAFDKGGERIVSVGLDVPAFQAGLYRANTVSDAYARSGLLDVAAYDPSFWSGTPGGQGFRFREPIRTIKDVIHEHGGVTMASTHMLVEDEAGRRWRWWVLWYWDDTRWQILQTSCGGWDAVMFF